MGPANTWLRAKDLQRHNISNTVNSISHSFAVVFCYSMFARSFVPLSWCCYHHHQLNVKETLIVNNNNSEQGLTKLMALQWPYKKELQESGNKVNMVTNTITLTMTTIATKVLPYPAVLARLVFHGSQHFRKEGYEKCQVFFSFVVIRIKKALSTRIKHLKWMKKTRSKI